MVSVESGVSETLCPSPVSSYFVSDLQDLAQEIWLVSENHGWHEEDAHYPTWLVDVKEIGLTHAELSEMLEALRRGQPLSEKLPGFLLVEEEAADVVIRTLHMGARNNWRLAEAILAKLDYNRSRPHKHGGKVF